MQKYFLLTMNRFMKKINRSFVFASSFVFIISLFLGCSSLKQPKEIFEFPDYSEADAVENEKKRIDSLVEKTPVQALWRASLLGDEEYIQKQEDIVFELLEKALEKKDFFKAESLYQSLLAVGSKKLSSVSEKNIRNEYVNEIPGLVTDKKLLPSNIQNCIDATVTIWVDKGIAIHNGIGYADRVLGSGFFIDKRGYLITNHHVINDMVDPKYEGYSRLYIKLASDQDIRIPAKVVGYDSVLDLALLKAEIDPPFILSLGSSKELEIGDKVSAIGTPLGLHGTLTSGIVSAVDRKLFTTGNVLQIDTAVNSGNSGGPLIDKDMQVQAIVFAGIQQYQGLNFAIPVEYLRQDLPFLYYGGKRKHVWLGAYGHTKREVNKNVGLEVQYVMPGGVASRSGLVKGDVITFVADKRVYTLEMAQDVLRNFSSESIVKLNYVRDGESREVLVYLDERPEQPGYEIYTHDLISHSMFPIFGMELESCSTISSKKYIISDILKGSIADESGFSVTDPVHITDVDFSEKNEAISVQMNTRKRKKGYLDITIRIGSQLDSPYYF